MTKVLVLGAGGFLGRAISARLATVSTIAHTAGYRQIPADYAASDFTVRSDVTDRQSLFPVMTGMDWVIHTANYIGQDEGAMRSVNVLGTNNVVDAAARAGARVLYISTTSVYGHGPFTGQDEHSVPISPASKLSISRARAEEFVLDAGGVVLRPHLTFGRGDRWFIPSLVDFTRRIGGCVNDGTGITSVIDVDVLSEIVASIVTRPQDCFAGRALHASHPRPTAFRMILDDLERDLGAQLPGTSVTFAEALDTGRRYGITRHQVELLGLDHWFSSAALWTLLETPPPADPFLLNDAGKSWYRKILL